MDNPLAYEDLNDWWDDLTIEQRRAAFVAWQKTDIKSIWVEGLNGDKYVISHSEAICPSCFKVMDIPDHK